MLSNMLAVSILSAIALLASHVDAAPPITEEVCHTFYGPQNGLVATTTSATTVTLRPTVRYTSTPSTVINGPASTITRTATFISTTSLSLVTDTYTTTVLSTETDSATVPFTTYVTSILTSTSTVGDGTSTVGIPDGFVYPTATPGGLKARTPESLVRRAGAVIARAPNSPHRHGAARRYPSKVVCNVVVQTVIPTTIMAIARSTRTITLPGPRRTGVISRTSTFTRTFPDASTTTTVYAPVSTTTTTFTSTETDTITSTQTATYTLPAFSTYYPVCATPVNELTQGPNGNSLMYLAASNVNAVPVELSTVDAYSCCALCFTIGGCLGSNYGPGYGDTSCELELSADGTCPANQGGNAGSYTEAGDGDITVTISNGPCGTFLYQ